jgi:hypothetical protein
MTKMSSVIFAVVSKGTNLQQQNEKFKEEADHKLESARYSSFDTVNKTKGKPCVCFILVGNSNSIPVDDQNHYLNPKQILLFPFVVTYHSGQSGKGRIVLRTDDDINMILNSCVNLPIDYIICRRSRSLTA